MNFEDLLTPKPYRWPKRGDLPFQKAKSAEAAGFHWWPKRNWMSSSKRTRSVMTLGCLITCELIN